MLLFLVIGIMLFPAVQKQFHIFNENPLHGDVRLAPDIAPNAGDWFESRFSRTKEKYLNDNFGFRSWFVRLKNQVYFSAFHRTFEREVVFGKSGYLYEARYLNTYAGKDYMGDRQIENRFEKLKLIQDSLSKRGITFVVLFAPGKASYFPEYIPDSFPAHPARTNYQMHIQAARKFGINHIDFNGWFLKTKTESAFPMYAQTSTHWSTYAMYVAFDSINRYLDQLLHKKLPRYSIGKVEWKEQLSFWDMDMEVSLNLFSALPHHKMPYPSIVWADTQNCFKPRVLTISDSYWSGLNESGLTKKVYTQPEYWFYNQLVFRGDSARKGFVSTDFDLKTAVEQRDVVMIMASEANLRFMGWDFIEEVYNMYTNGPASYARLQASRKKTIEITSIKNFIAFDEVWFNSIKEKAQTEKISVDSSLQNAALKEYAEKHKSDPPDVNNSGLKNSSLKRGFWKFFFFNPE